ncbi:arginyl-tRNA synthetase [Tamaricihabitans halophyticus]|uniref:Arginine--tRNA ligase n=1 Tax=Tamaricihabitans halophyticus TaxID=1262583 RepID=A0A4R2QJT2_9PSEU|nr:arginine--tRNA ligase [Tamaricihabitans halophyticus]TCP47245.1 arginyl-tRNA synthetase [Tamaricihabitans halophyticus]
MHNGDVSVELARRVVAALDTALDVRITPAEALIRPSTREGADYQCNVAMSLGKRLGRPPREVATEIVAALDSADLVAQTEIAGPGFINLTLDRDWLQHRATALLDDARVGVAAVEQPRRFAIDYGSPNVAKEMHVGHLRSSIIGDAIARLLRFEGHEVIAHNHLGDWGTPFGMLIEHLIDEGWTSDSEHTISDLNGFYQEARKKFDADPEFADRSRTRVVQLQGGDARTLELWQQLVDESTRHFEKVYQLLGVQLRPEDIYGESFYNPYLNEVVEELEAKGLTELSDGAVCMFPPGFTNRDGDRLPLIVRKRDGGYGYATTDLATARYWAGERGATDLLYVVGTPQAQHFAMVFAASRQAGWLTEEHNAQHVGFGSILGSDGKTIRTRAGGSIKLVELLNEAVDRAASVVAERSELDEQERAAVARAVGIGAIKYADLSGDREKDYTFDWNRMLAMDGNTAVYLQYANTRILSILRKAGEEPAQGTPVLLAEPAERALLLKLLQLPSAISATTESYAPHKLCNYLYETATAFSSFYEKCPVLAESTPPELRRSRLVLAKLTSNVLTLGLSLLGIDAPTRL